MILFSVSNSVVLLLLSIIATCTAQQGSITQKYRPCPSRVLVLQRRLDGPPGRQNSWRGRIGLRRFGGIAPVQLTLTLDNPAEFTLHDGYGQVTATNNGYQLYYAEPVEHVFFSVRGSPYGGFPAPTGLYLNGVDICNSEAVGGRGGGGGGGRWRGRGHGHSKSNSAIRVVCGRKQINHQGLITHGYPTNEGDWPWHAALFLRTSSDSSRYICGGTLISAETILTAAHCLLESGHSITPNRLIIKLGLHNRAVGNSHTQEYPVFDVIIHDNFEPATFKHDIALIKLSQRVTFSSYVQPICLWPATSAALDTVIDHTGIIVGWGLDERERLSNILKEGSMPIVSVSSCLQSNPSFFGNLLTDHNYCAGYRNGTSVCNGDSGGGMYFTIDNVYYIRGIVSLAVSQDSKSTCNPQHFAVFTDVAKHLNWIQTA